MGSSRQRGGYTALVATFAVGYACGGGGGAAVSRAADLLYEFGGASLARQLEQAGLPMITAPFGIAESVPDDGTRHFTLTVATENRQTKEDSAALYALMDGHGPIGGIWGANVLAFAHSDMLSGAVQGLEVDVGNLGTPSPVPVTAVNAFAMGPVPSDVAYGVLNGIGAGPGGFREGLVFRSNPPGVAVTESLIRVHPGFGETGSGIDLRAARFRDLAIATPGFAVDPQGGVRSQALASGSVAFVCVDAAGRLFASSTSCVASP